METKELFRMKSNYREDMLVQGYRFGKGEKAACIAGAVRGNEIQQLYICSQLVKQLKELENKGCINANKEIMVIPAINPFSINTGKRFWGIGDIDRKATPPPGLPPECWNKSATTPTASSLPAFTCPENSSPMSE